MLGASIRIVSFSPHKNLSMRNTLSPNSHMRKLRLHAVRWLGKGWGKSINDQVQTRGLTSALHRGEKKQWSARLPVPLLLCPPSSLKLSPCASGFALLNFCVHVGSRFLSSFECASVCILEREKENIWVNISRLLKAYTLSL